MDTFTGTNPVARDAARRVISVTLNEDAPGGPTYLTAHGANVVFTVTDGSNGFTVMLLDGVKTTLPGPAGG